ncbi:hypothetical protein [Mobiluncus curtisii]|uniref:hypothetical protein n=1 Tax=Mobiluncus curtisii TaxID=2051 RepID=UPI00146FDCBD|nr:hypothetical protein [Mobiluncus curtisii]MCU9986635.1 hypothetical protein [Mobiluncus curtisii]MCV0020027.1 hypothetical protein [Mobiluncus curtisii]NMX12805.1 hypothetical protein [Mobiluncus curtisii]
MSVLIKSSLNWDRHPNNPQTGAVVAENGTVGYKYCHQLGAWFRYVRGVAAKETSWPEILYQHQDATLVECVAKTWKNSIAPTKPALYATIPDKYAKTPHPFVPAALTRENTYITVCAPGGNQQLALDLLEAATCGLYENVRAISTWRGDPTPTGRHQAGTLDPDGWLLPNQAAKTPKIYVIGPNNTSILNRVAELVEQSGYQPVLPPMSGPGWGEQIYNRASVIKTVDKIMLIPGWERNELARIENTTAIHYGINVWHPAPETKILIDAISAGRE